MPIFRSQAQARILSWLLLDPRREQSIASLSTVSGVAQPNTLREVNLLVAAGLLSERRAGNTRLVRANTESPYFSPMLLIVARAFGPAHIVPEELRQVPGIERAYIIGSWAERFAGMNGPPPADIDVLVVGSPDRRALRAANARLEERLTTSVQLVVVSPSEWDEASSGFLREVQSGHPLQVLPAPAGPGSPARASQRGAGPAA
jgi:predicted nucleotidyltransferase